MSVLRAEAGCYPHDAERHPEIPLQECLSAILYGVVSRGFDGPDGVTKDEALEYAAVLAERVRAVVQWIEDTECTCPGDVYYGSLPDHECGCPAQVEHLLTTDTKGSS
jgi:hypothetical protein